MVIQRINFCKFLLHHKYSIDMRTLFFSFVVLFFSTTLFGQPKDEEKERQRIVEGNVKTITQWTHRFSAGKPNPTGYKTTETTFDKKGNPIEIVNYRSSGEISSRLLYKYNDQNLRTEYLMFQKVEGPELKVHYKQSFNYNAKGQKIIEVVFDGVTGYRITYDYYPDGQLKEIVKYGAGNRVDERWVYTYDGNNQQINIFSPDKNPTSIVKKKFDSNGNLVEDARFDTRGNEQKKVTYQYDSKSRTIEMVEYYSGKQTKKLQYQYNDFDLVTEIVQHNPDGSKFTQSKYSYDTKGNLIEERWSEGQSDEFSHKQSSFDKEGNVLETDQYFAPYRYRVLYKYSYSYH
jgi:YD repeat-containing protein